MSIAPRSDACPASQAAKTPSHAQATSGVTMKLIGMLDSPFVRRVAVSLQLLDLRFEHQSLSVFRHFDAFRALNPVVKVPTLVCDDGEVLMESTLILAYAESLAGRSLMPAGGRALQHELRLIGLALMACEKSVQVYYERDRRPPERVYAPWLERVQGQAVAAYQELEAELARAPLAATRERITQAGISTAVAWGFTQNMLPELVPAGRYPQLAALGVAAEALAEFRAAPFGEGVVASAQPA
jgi:glutathione S-transferase